MALDKNIACVYWSNLKDTEEKDIQGLTAHNFVLFLTLALENKLHKEWYIPTIGKYLNIIFHIQYLVKDADSSQSIFSP